MIVQLFIDPNTDSPNKETSGSRWQKPLLVAVPLLMVLTFFYTACQFTEPDFPFIPKGAKVKRLYLLHDLGYGPRLIESTEFTWTLKQGELESLKKAILAKGFLPPGEEHLSAYNTFYHPNGDDVSLAPEVFSRTIPPIIFMHQETRPVHEKIKRFFYWLKNRK